MPRPDRSTHDERLRRLLADTRHEEPVPTPVVERLDRVLDDLVAQDPLAAPGTDEVVDLAARRRRRGRHLLVAAAAVLVVGIGVGQVIGPRDGDESGSADSTSEGSSSDDAAAPDSGNPPEGESGGSRAAEPALPEDDGAPSLQQAPQPDAVPPGRRFTPAVVRPTSFLRDVRRLRTAPGTRVVSPTQEVSEEDLGTGPGFVCDPPVAYGTGRLIPVRYEQQTAILVYRQPSGRTQTVDLLQCGSAAVLRSTTLALG